MSNEPKNKTEPKEKRPETLKPKQPKTDQAPDDKDPKSQYEDKDQS